MNKTVVIITGVLLIGSIVVLGIVVYKQGQTKDFLESKKGQSIPIAA